MLVLPGKYEQVKGILRNQTSSRFNSTRERARAKLRWMKPSRQPRKYTSTGASKANRGVRPMSTIHLRAARRCGMLSSLSQIWKIQLARSSAGKLKAPRTAETAKKGTARGDERSPGA